MNTAPIIRPEIYCAKQAAMKNLQAPKFEEAVRNQPPLVEFGWYIQNASMQPGWLDKFIDDFLSVFSDSIGTEAMHSIGKTDEAYTLGERHAVIASFPRWGDSNIDADYVLSEFRKEMFGDDGDFESTRKTPDIGFINRQNHAYFYDYCKRVARAVLRSALVDFCTKPDAVLPDAWYFKDLPGDLLQTLDVHAGRLSQEIVMTEVTRHVFDALDFAWTEKAMVEVIGDSRFGKTESVKAWCAMYPDVIPDPRANALGQASE